MALRSGGGVLCIAALQILVAICLLGIYEAFKVRSWGSRLAVHGPCEMGQTHCSLQFRRSCKRSSAR